MSDVAVVGSGVVGLTSAYELAADNQVTVLYDVDLLESTSAIATAIWHVYLVRPDDDTNLRWSEVTLRTLLQLCRSEPSAGVELPLGVELFRTSTEHDPPWSNIALSFRKLTRSEVASYDGANWGYEIQAPTVSMRKYLPWLKAEAVKRGVQFQKGTVSALADLSARYDFVVNCTGLRASELVADSELTPVKGQYVVYSVDGDLPDYYIGDDENPAGMAYSIPRGGRLVVGGTSEPGISDLDFTESESEMLTRALTYVQGIERADLTVEERVVGLRPWRRSGNVRFGFDESQPNLFHNYGHGGSGFSLSWGCAADLASQLHRH